MREIFEKINKELEDLIDNNESDLYHHNDIYNNAIYNALDVVDSINEKYKDKYVHRELLDQIKWERDIALMQLEELGYVLGEKVWIPCDEQLPSSDGRFEVTIKGKNGKRHVEMCNFNKNATYTPWGIDNWEHGNVIAWRKRPKPYKERKATIMKQRIDKLINYILSQKEYELCGIYNSRMEHMVAEHDMELKNEVIDDIVYIIREEFKDLEEENNG